MVQAEWCCRRPIVAGAGAPAASPEAPSLCGPSLAPAFAPVSRWQPSSPRHPGHPRGLCSWPAKYLFISRRLRPFPQPGKCVHHHGWSSRARVGTAGPQLPLLAPECQYGPLACAAKTRPAGGEPACDTPWIGSLAFCHCVPPAEDPGSLRLLPSGVMGENLAPAMTTRRSSWSTPYPSYCTRPSSS